MGYVYVAEAGKYVKIGYSEKSVEHRMKTIQVGCPVEINRVWCSRNIPDAFQCEKILHRWFEKQKSNGEWFEIPFFEAAEKADEVCRDGADVIRIRELEKENAQLKDMITKMYTREEIMQAFAKLLPQKNTWRAWKDLNGNIIGSKDN